MKYRNNSLRVYPVLLPDAHDYENSRFFANDVKTEVSGNDVIISGNIVLENSCIASIVKNGDMTICCVVDCPSTKYREVFPFDYSKIDNWRIRIPSSMLNNAVELMFSIVAVNDITCPLPQSTLGVKDYSDDDVVVFPKNAPIAYSETHMAMFKKSEKLDDKSICIITEDKNNKHISYNADMEQIRINVPSEWYRTYVSTNNFMVRTKHAILIVPVLADIIGRIQEDMDDNGSTAYMQYAWFKTIEEKLSECGYKDLESRSFIEADRLILAQEVIGDATGQALDEIADSIQKGAE